MLQVIQEANPVTDIFTGPPELIVPAGVAGYYALSFTAPIPGVFKASLVLTAPATEEKWTYLLEGEAKDPPAVDHIAMSCQSGVKTAVSIDVPNHSEADIVYEVFTDLPVVQGNPTLAVPASSAKKYDMALWAMMSGTYTGTVTFTNSNGNYEWFTVALDVLEPQALAYLEVEAVVGTAKEIKVHVDNPCSEHITLNATYDDSSALTGPKNYVLAPYESKDIKFFFCPVEAAGSTARFMLANPRVGEFWCDLTSCIIATTDSVHHLNGHVHQAGMNLL